jgi:ubiquinone/menaquinone biosynthesis C-methylase UbiE
MDYDKTCMAENYDAGRGQPVEALTRWLIAAEAHMGGQAVNHIVDAGCGTGRYSGVLADYFGATVLAVDPSEKMLAEARAKAFAGAVEFTAGSAESLPCEDGVADLVFMSMVFHHLRDRAAAGRECARVLRPGGHICVRNSTLEKVPDMAYSEFFPEVVAATRDEAPARADIIAAFTDAGAPLKAAEMLETELAADWQSYVERISLRADSYLARISDDAFERGLAAMRDKYPPGGGPAPVLDTIELFVFQKPLWETS